MSKRSPTDALFLGGCLGTLAAASLIGLYVLIEHLYNLLT